MTHATVHNTINKAHNSYLKGQMKSEMPTRQEFERALNDAWEIKENYNLMLDALKGAEKDYKGMALTFDRYGYTSSRNEAIETANHLTALIKKVSNK